MHYKPPDIRSGHGVIRELAGIKGTVTAVTMEEPWRLMQESMPWAPDCVHMVTGMDLETLERLERELPACDTVVGIGGGSCCDTAKFVAWKRNCRMILVPTIVSVDAPLTDTIGVRVDNVVKYVGKIYPQELLVDYDIIRKAPPDLNRAGAGDIASIHTALYDWQLAHERNGEAFHADVAQLARDCLERLDANAKEVFNVSPRGIDTIIDLYRREVEFCACIGTSRPEEGAEHIVAYNLERLTGRHFIHGDLVALGIFVIARLQQNEPEWIEDLMLRTGLRIGCPDATVAEIRNGIESLKPFKDNAGLFFSILDVEPITPEFVDTVLAELERIRRRFLT